MSLHGVTPAMVALAARRFLRPGISKVQAVICAVAELDGRPLDPEKFDDSAIILRCEQLLTEGVGVREALKVARAELIMWSIPSEDAL